MVLAPDANRMTAYVVDPVTRTVSNVPRGLAQMMVGGGGNNHFVLARSMRRFVSLFQVPADVESTSAISEE